MADANRYVFLYRRGHPLAKKNGQVAEHRLVMWEAGLLTDRSLHVHHVNGDKRDNRIENLRVVTKGEHSRIHHSETREATHCKRGHPWTPENTYIHPNGGRYCRTCHNERNRLAKYTRRPDRAH